MSESSNWTCPSCQFEWVVPVGEQCLCCGYQAPGSVETERRTTSAVQEAMQTPDLKPSDFLARLTQPVVDDPLAPLYPPGSYPAPVEEPATVNGITRGVVHGEASVRADGSRAAGALPGTSPAEQERQAVHEAALAEQYQKALQLIHALGRQGQQLQQQLTEAAQVESTVRAELAQWQQVYEELVPQYHKLRAGSDQKRRQLITLAEENQRLRQIKAHLEKEQLAPRELPDHIPSRAIQPAWKQSTEEAFRLGRVELQIAELVKAIASVEQLVQQVAQQAVYAQDQQVSVEEDPGTYQTFIATDQQAARIEQEILRSQAQYNQGWRG